jgi:hypothetical protein
LIDMAPDKVLPNISAIHSSRKWLEVIDFL